MTPADLRTRRLALGLSQAAIAGRLGVDPNTWWRWEAGQRAPENPDVLALALDHLGCLAASEPKPRGRPRKRAAA